MSDVTEPAPDFSAAAQREWNEHVEQVLRGIAHALNNRAAALSAVVELARDDDDPETTTTILQSEFGRVRELVDIVRSIGAPRAGGEAFSPKEAAEEALQVLRLHSEQRESSVTLDASAAPPIRAPRWMFVRAIIALVATGVRAAQRRQTVTLSMTEEDDVLAVRLRGAAQHASAQSLYAAELAAAMGGSFDGGTMRVPTLVAVRRREGR